MAVDPTQIALTPNQKQRLAEIAERKGRDYTEVVDEMLSAVNFSEENGTKVTDQPPRTAYQAMKEIGAIGCVTGGPTDLSTNPKHMEGFGVNASQQDSDCQSTRL